MCVILIEPLIRSFAERAGTVGVIEGRLASRSTRGIRKLGTAWRRDEEEKGQHYPFDLTQLTSDRWACSMSVGLFYTGKRVNVNCKRKENRHT